MLRSHHRALQSTHEKKTVCRRVLKCGGWSRLSSKAGDVCACGWYVVS